MRKIIFQMMTTLNGRLDDPYAWLTDIGDDQYRAIDSLYATYDTVLIGRTTYEEMASYWPGVLADADGTKTHQAMARRMNAYWKLVFSKSADEMLTEWHNTERVIVASDQELARYVKDLKAGPGENIHLSGGASFARSVVTLGLVDEFHLFVYPVVSLGKSWFSQLAETLDLQLLSASTFDNGVVWLHYEPDAPVERPRPDSFTELLT